MRYRFILQVHFSEDADEDFMECDEVFTTEVHMQPGPEREDDLRPIFAEAENLLIARVQALESRPGVG